MFTLPQLPYDLDALEPAISKHQLDVHYHMHHAKYVNKLNDLLKHTEFRYSNSLEDIVKYKWGESNDIFNNAAQHYNHSFYWKSMSPHPTTISSLLAQVINDAFGSVSIFKDLFLRKGMASFGSGWIWLIKDPISIVVTHDADTPLRVNKTPLLTCDLWEHAYYIDYENGKEQYLKAFLSELINWDFALENYDR